MSVQNADSIGQQLWRGVWFDNTAMTSRRKQTLTEDASLETTVPTDLSFSPDEISELYTTDDDRLRAERYVGRSGQVN